MANRAYRLGQRHAARPPYDPGPYRVTRGRPAGQPDAVRVTGNAVTYAERARSYRRPTAPTEAELEAIEMREGVRSA